MSFGDFGSLLATDLQTRADVFGEPDLIDEQAWPAGHGGRLAETPPLGGRAREQRGSAQPGDQGDRNEQTADGEPEFRSHDVYLMSFSKGC